MRFEFFFDCSSPWTYLAFERVQPLAAEFGLTIEWRPILVGGIFNAVNPGVEWFKALDKTPPRKTEYWLKDMQDWARATDLKIKFPPTGHPVNSVKVMRGCIALQRLAGEQNKLVPFARAAFEAYFRDDRLISDDAVITDICKQTGVDPAWLLATVATQEMKDALRANTDEAIARNAFGSPTMYLDETDMYFGVDRLQLVRAALERDRDEGAAPTAR
jgi:2-hydroxychromene-2-carboxylate isomerase